MTEKVSVSYFLDSLREAYGGLVAKGLVVVQTETFPGGVVARVVPYSSAGPKVELRVAERVAELFVVDLDPIEIDETVPDDRVEFDSFVRSLVAGEAAVSLVRIFGRWRPQAIEWPSGSWSLPGFVGLAGLIAPRRRENLPAYS